ncbi:MAG: tetratricopeptide repeat protein [Fulvivirga sp.]|nr:tetratricopeptide repeat protein [Fulvivirga sp.]
MKRTILIMAICLVAGFSYGQKKPKINKAEKARSEGNLAEAKSIVDAAIEHEKTKDDGKTWYYRGLVYASLDTTSNPDYQNLVDNPLEIAMKSFAKADEIDPEGSNYYLTGPNGLPVLKDQQILQLSGHYINKGIQHYQDSDYDKAVQAFEKTQMIMPEDTTGYINAALAARAAKDYDVVAENYYKLIEDLDYKSVDAFNFLIYYESSIQEDDEKALAVIRSAKKAFPNNLDFAKSEIAALKKMGKADEAMKGLNDAIENEPDNPDLYFTLGILHEELGNLDKARDAYENAVKIDPSYYDGVYNLAVIDYNKAVNLIREKNNLGISSADQKKAKEMQVQIEKRLKTALPNWEKANELKPGDRTTLETLQYIYSQLGMNAKVMEIAEQLEGGDQ